MQYQLIDLLDPQHFLTNIQAPDARNAIEQLSQTLLRSQHVQAGFADDVWQRELIFPTGLPTQPFGIAIPHADPDHVNRSAVAIGVLTQPVPFAQMGMDNETIIQAKIIFLLAIKEKEKQIEMLQQLMMLIQSPHVLDSLTTMQSGQEAITFLQQI